MAGDTKGANNVSKNRANKARKLNWKDDRSTNKIYASGQVSTVNPTPAAGVVRGAAPPAKRTRVVDRTAVRSSDEYYRAETPAPTAQQAARAPAAGKLGPLPPVGQPRRRPSALPTGVLTVHTVDDVKPVIDELAERLQAGATAVVLYVDRVQGLLNRTRAALELLVTREIITEDQSHEVRLSYPPEAPAAPPVPANTVKVEDGPIDPVAFLNGDIENPDDAPVDVEAAPVTEHTEPILRDGEAGDEGDNDFMLPTTPVAPPIDAVMETEGVEAVNDFVSEKGAEAPATDAPEAAPAGDAPETPDAPAPTTRRGRGRKAN